MTPPRADRRRRRLAHVALLAVLSLAGAALLHQVVPAHTGVRQEVSLALAYISLAALLACLTIGPLRLLTGRPNPLNHDVRRDTGLWAAATGVAHVAVALGNHFDGDLLAYFFRNGRVTVAELLHYPFGWSSWLGALATLLLVVLAAVSSDRALRLLRRRWKRVQRLAYLAAVAAAGHTALLWVLLDRTPGAWVPALLAMGGVACAQAAGAFTWRRRANRRRASPRERSIA